MADPTPPTRPAPVALALTVAVADTRALLARATCQVRKADKMGAKMILLVPLIGLADQNGDVDSGSEPGSSSLTLANFGLPVCSTYLCHGFAKFQVDEVALKWH